MKSTKTTARRLVGPADFANPKEARAWLAEKPGAPPILDRFSIEQRAQISRLILEGDFEGTTKEEAAEEAIATLAEVGLYALGLDPLAEEAVARLSEVVYGGEGSFSADLFNAMNDDWEIAQTWTKKQRTAERERAKGRAA